jgi:signal transduction histidine kinase
VDYRLYSLPVMRDDEAIAVVQVGRSLSEQDRQLTQLGIVLFTTGTVGLVLAALGGLLVAGRALRPIRESFSRQRAFVADASHELRTPLTIIRGNAEMLELNATGRLDDEDRRGLQEIVGQAVYMEQLMSDLSLLARMDESQLALRIEPVEIAGVVRGAGNAALTLGASKNLVVDAIAPPGMVVEGDRVRLQELLLAVVDNAVRHTPEGGRIVIVAQDGDSPTISVADSGPGIPLEHLERIFDRFYRADEARSHDGGGTGLGLSVAQAIAKAHGGRMTAENAAAGGAVFTLHLPGAKQGGTARP